MTESDLPVPEGGVGSAGGAVGADDAPRAAGRLRPGDVIDAHRSNRAGVGKDMGAGVRWLGSSQILGQMIRIGMTLVLTRLLTPEEFGVVALVMVVTGLFERVLGDTGTGAALVRHPELRHGLASSVLWLNIGVGALTAGAFALLGGPVAALLGDSSAASLVRVVGLAGLIGGFGHVQRSMLRRLRKFRALAVVNLSNIVFTAVATIAFAVAGWGEWALVIGNLAGNAISVAVAWAMSGWRPAFYFSRREVREISGFSTNVSLQNLFGYFSFAGDRFIIGRFIGTSELGYYGLANRLLRYPLQTSAQTYREVVFPTLARVQDDHVAMRDAYRRTLEGITFLIVPLCFVVAALAGPMVAAVLGPKWVPATDVVRIMALVSALQAVTTTTGALYLAKGRSDLSLRWQIIAAAVLMVTYSTGAIWGVTGVAWGYFAGIALLTYPAFRIPLALIDTKPRDVLGALLPTVLASGAASGVGWAVAEAVDDRFASPWPPLLTGLAAFAAVYGTYVVVARPPVTRDLVRMLTTKRRRRARRAGAATGDDSIASSEIVPDGGHSIEAESSMAHTSPAPTGTVETRTVETARARVAGDSTKARLFPSRPDWGHRPALDGVRALAVYLVVAFHAGILRFEGGFIGVDVFFVLSGFLMTNVLLTEIDSTGSLRLKRFYARRMRRLAPASIVAILATAGALILVLPFAERLRLVDDARAALVYLANWNLVSSATDYFAAEDAPSAFLHFWSLSLEEQYYAFFPLLLLAIVFVTRKVGNVWAIPAALGGLGLASLAAQIYWQRTDPIRAYYGTDARLYQILAGAVLAAVFLIRFPRLRREVVATATALVAVAVLVVFATDLVDVSPSVRGMVATAGSITLIVGLELGRRSPIAKLFELKTMTFLGAISYGTYLWHWPVILVLRRMLDIAPWTLLAVAAPLATGLAALSYQVLETPIRRSKRLDPYPLPVALAGLAACALAAVFVVAPILRSEQKPSLDRPAAIVIGASDLGAERVPDDIDYRALAGDRSGFPTCGPANPERCTVVDGDGLHVLLVGDSHARMLIPTFTSIAESHDLTFSVNVTPSCPWQYGVTNALRPEAEQRTCARQREAWYRDVLPVLDPDVIVFASLARDGEGATRASMTPVDASLAGLSMDDLIVELTDRTLDLVRADRTVIIVEPVPGATFNPLDCLSGADLVIDCAFEAGDGPPSEATYRAVAERDADVATINLDPITCPDLPVCLPIVDGVVTRRDRTHITTEFAAAIADDVWATLESSGPLGPG